MNKDNCTLVVSHFASLTFLPLVDMLKKKCRIIIYDKSINGLLNNDNNILKNKEFIDYVNIIKLENKSIDPQAIFEYIITYYDNLTEYNIFIQDDSHHHLPDFNHFINYCNNCIINNIGFKDYPASNRADLGQGRVQRTIIDGNIQSNFVSPICAKNFCNKFGIEILNKYTIEACAHLIVSKRNILKRDKEWYKKMDDFSYTAECLHPSKIQKIHECRQEFIDNFNSGKEKRNWPHNIEFWYAWGKAAIYEQMWPLIFN
jgi:hypothetical protein